MEVLHSTGALRSVARTFLSARVLVIDSDFVSPFHAYPPQILSSLGSGRDCTYPTHASHIQPKNNVKTVIGAPTLKYSQNPIGTSFFAVSTTMIFATDPVIVRLPANVPSRERAMPGAD